MYREITLSKATRCFTAGLASLLCRSKKIFPAGTSLTVSPPEWMRYDHRDHQAVSCDFGGTTYYLLVADLNLPAPSPEGDTGQ